MKNLITALDFGISCLETLRIYDNSRFDKPLKPLLYLRQGVPTYLSEDSSPWLANLLQGTKFDIMHLRKILKTSAARKGLHRSQ